MPQYSITESILDDFEEDVTSRGTATPTAKFLLVVNKQSPKKYPAKEQNVRSSGALLPNYFLHPSLLAPTLKLPPPSLLPPALLNTKVNKDDWKKLKHLLVVQYLYSAIGGLKLIIAADFLLNVGNQGLGQECILCHHSMSCLVHEKSHWSCI
jgi:hypothetical protein